MEAIKEFFAKDVVISDGVSVQVWVFFAVIIAIILMAVVIILSTRKDKKEKTNDQTVITDESMDFSTELSPEEASKQFFEVLEGEPIKEEKVVSEANKEEKATKINENVPAEEKTEEIKEVVPVSENKIVTAKATEDIVKNEAPVKKSEVKNEQIKSETLSKEMKKEKTIQNAETPSPISENVKDTDDVIIENETTSDVNGKFVIVNSSLGGFRYLLLANNGQLLYESRDYKSKKTCEGAIPKFQNAVDTGVFTARKDKFGRYKFSLKPIDNVNTIYIGESFNQNSSCLKNIESVKRFINSPIVDRTDDEKIVSISTAYTIPTEIAEQVNNNQGAKGTFEIAKSDEDDIESPFVYLLYANNGQLLYESKEYKSYSSCKSGMLTFIETVKDGVFIVDSDKAGRFKFVLRSNKAGSQAEYIGQFYSSKKACENSIDSVYKFALLSPTCDIK